MRKDERLRLKRLVKRMDEFRARAEKVGWDRGQLGSGVWEQFEQDVESLRKLQRSK